MMGFEPTTLRLEVVRAIQLRHTDRCSDSDSNRELPRKGPRILTIRCYQNKMHGGGFEPPKRYALDLKSNPFDQTRVSMLEDCHSDNCEI